jgi:tetratricopeptide (TPR) repeat protein
MDTTFSRAIDTPSRKDGSLVYLLLAFVTLAVYSGVASHSFINFDDQMYVTHNEYVRSGLNATSLAWAFGVHSSNWHPLTWLSHMLDCQLFGLSPGMHHLVNLLFHICNTLLLLRVLQNMTGSLWKSAAVALLFALHPLHVESVAWVAERKDVLSTFFFLATLWSYQRYVVRPAMRAYLITLALFALGLMSKPMVVSLPILLLLLDYWPLDRFRGEGPAGAGAQRSGITVFIHLIWEKVPFFLLALASCVVTYVVQQQAGSVKSFEVYPLSVRVTNALISYAAYLKETVWPEHLAVFYPHPGKSPMVWLALSVCLLAGLTVVALRHRQTRPYLLVGWLWYLVTLLPVIGLVQVGAHAMADRYTYVPLIGIFVALAWGISEWIQRWGIGRQWLISAGVFLMVILAGLSWHQLRYWTDSTTLFSHALAVTRNNYIAHLCLGGVYEEEGNLPAAASEYRAAVQAKPDYALCHFNLANVLDNLGQWDEAIDQFESALKLAPTGTDVYFNLGIVLYEKGDLSAAMSRFQQLIAMSPDYRYAHFFMALILEKQGNVAEAITQYQTELRVNPTYAIAHNQLGMLLASVGRTDEAAVQFKQALAIRQDFTEARDNLEALHGAHQTLKHDQPRTLSQAL